MFANQKLICIVIGTGKSGKPLLHVGDWLYNIQFIMNEHGWWLPIVVVSALGGNANMKL